MESGFEVEIRSFDNDGWPFVGLLTYASMGSWRVVRTDMMAMMAWCREQFGLEWNLHSNESGIWTFMSDRFYFRDEDAAFAFRMRWSGWQSSPLTGD